MDFSAFSHGQIQSKLWLCQELEPFINNNSKIAIVGCWYNLLGFMLLTRRPNYYECIHGIDINHKSIDTANKLCDAWLIEPNCIIKNFCSDINEVNLNYYDVIISTSCEDIETTTWFNNLSSSKVICLQSTNLDNSITNKFPDWDIKNPNYDLESFKKKFPVTKLNFADSKFFDYGELKYQRFMLIGIT
jgi:hypothetical protein